MQNVNIFCKLKKILLKIVLLCKRYIKNTGEGKLNIIINNIS